MSNATEMQINTTAVITLTRCLQQGANRRQAIILARDELINTLELSRDTAELACWRVMAELESRSIPAGHGIDIGNTTSHLLVIRTPNHKLVFTLADLLGLHERHGETAQHVEQLKPTLH